MKGDRPCCYLHTNVSSITCTQKAYDSHCNLVLGDVEETHYIQDEDDESELKVRNSDDYQNV